MPRYSDAFRAEILRLHAEGLIQLEIAEKVNCSRTTVGTILRANGIRTKATPKPVPAERRCECGCGARLSPKRAAARFISGHQWRAMTKGQLSQREAALEEPMSGRCGRCQDWHVSGPAKAVIRAFHEHRDRCPARESVAAA